MRTLLLLAVASVGVGLLACGGSAGVDAGAGGGGGSAAGGGTAAGDCAGYCADIASNCSGASAQWVTTEACLTECAVWPVGASADVAGNTLGCRRHWAQVAAADAGAGCPAAGPSGGDQDVADSAPGTCGEGCESFCAVAQAVCTAGNTQFGGVPACLAVCKTFKPSSAPYSTADTGKNDFGCRVYHLGAAAQSPAAAVTHCPHIAATSSVCTN